MLVGRSIVKKLQNLGCKSCWKPYSCRNHKTRLILFLERLHYNRITFLNSYLFSSLKSHSIFHVWYWNVFIWKITPSTIIFYSFIIELPPLILICFLVCINFICQTFFLLVEWQTTSLSIMKLLNYEYCLSSLRAFYLSLRKG